MSFSVASHLARLKAAVFETYGLDKVPEWITTKTFLHGRRYSFRGHEFQYKVLTDESQEVNVQKCSQIGMTEAQARWSLGMVATFPNFSLIYTMPFSGDAELLCRTRVDPIIEGSPDLKSKVKSDLNNSSIKQVGNSFIYFRGTQGTTQAISIPADAIVSDEIDRSAPLILSQYTSRLTHSAWKLRRNFSTPTVDGYGIAAKMQTSVRWRNICKCDRCGHGFVPSYYEHVKVPGFDDDLKAISKAMLARIRWKEARLICPKCGGTPSLRLEHREWVAENPTENHDAAGYYISPFDAPLLITVPSLIKASTDYDKVSEFDNQALGLTSIDKDMSLTRDDLVRSKVEISLVDSGIYAMGCDLGLTCRIVIGRIDPASERLLVVHREKVPLGRFEERVRALSAQFRCIVKVFDSQPYVDLIIRLQKTDPNLWAAVFVRSKKVEIYEPKEHDEKAEEGKLNLQQVQINRTPAFDSLVGHIKKIGMAFTANDDEDEDFITECLDLKRVQQRDDNMELVYAWEKSAAGTDHYFFALLYMYVAAKMRGTATNFLPLTQLVMTAKIVERPAQDGVRGLFGR